MYYPFKGNLSAERQVTELRPHAYCIYVCFITVTNDSFELDTWNVVRRWTTSIHRNLDDWLTCIVV